jgi:putative cell wall-binding protein
VAGIEGAALVLVGRDEIPPDSAAELARLRPDRIVIVGGVAAVSDAVREQLRDLTEGPVTRIAGDDRYETALELSQVAFDASSDVAYLVSGAGFAEALSAGPAAGLEGGPILLVQGSTLDDEVVTELQRLSASTIVIVGGTGSVSDALETDAVSRFGAAVVRAGSFTRYSSGVAVAERILDEDTATIFISTGEVFADGLAATPWAIREEAPIVLVPSDGRLPFRVVDLLEAHPDADIIVIGGTAAVSESIFDELEATRSGA